MSIIIKGIDKPKENITTAKVAINYLEPTRVIQIPKGARLIDANKLLEDVYTIVQLTGKGEQIETVVYADDIEDAPIIFESEEEE